MKKCLNCKKEFEPKGKKKFCSVKCAREYNISKGNFVHDHSDETKEKLRILARKQWDYKLGEIKTFKVICETCNEDFFVEEREKKFPKKEKYFCSIKCARSRGNRSEEVKNKIRESINKRNEEKGTVDFEIEKECLFCKENFFVKKSKENQQFCSISCSSKKRFRDPKHRNMLVENGKKICKNKS